MEKLLVKGGNKLKGEVTISGAKNAAVAILPACLLVKGNCRIENLPDIKDVKLFLRILEQLNADVKYIDKNTVDIDCTNVDSYRPLGELTRKMRGSSYLMGALLGRFSNFIVYPPGGCDFGTRPIDQHIKAFETLGADIDTSKQIFVVPKFVFHVRTIARTKDSPGSMTTSASTSIYTPNPRIRHPISR